MAQKVIIHNHAQLIGQVVMFVLAAIIFGMILLYGYQAIHSFLEKGRAVALATFYTDLAQGVDLIKRDVASVSRLELSLPAQYTEVCIADPIDEKGMLQAENLRMYNAWISGSENIFLIPPSPQPFKIEDIIVPHGAFCIPNTGKIILRLEGTGDKTQVTPWDS